MDQDHDDFPEWLRNQRGIRYRGQDQIPPGKGPWLNRNKLIRRYADDLIAANQPVSLEAIRAMLRFVDRGYSLNADQIGRALRSRYADGRVPKFTNATGVVIDGRRYRSIRAAATGESVSPQTVINRIESKRHEWRGWRRAG